MPIDSTKPPRGHDDVESEPTAPNQRRLPQQAPAPGRARHPTVPPPPPAARTPTGQPRSSSGAPRRPPTPPSSPSHESETEVWKIEMEILRRDADAVRERDPSRAALLHGAIAGVATAMLGDGPAGAAALQSASELSPPGSGDRWIAMFSRREALGARQWPQALELMRKELPQVGDPRERVALLLEIGTIEELVKGDRQAARQALEEAREIDPAHSGVLEALAEIYFAQSEWDRLVAVLGAMADTTLDVVHRSMLRHFSGLVHDVHLNNPPAARAAYKLALVDDPANLAAAVSLESLALEQEDWGELARILVAQAELVGEPRTVRRLSERAGDLYWERLGDAESAIGTFRRAARATPEEVAPLRKLSAVLESVGRWRELVEVYQAELPLVRDPEERADLYFRIGEVHEQYLGHLDEAVAAYQSALEQAPTHLPTLQALGALYRSTERWADLAKMELREAEKLTEPLRRAERYYEIAELVEQRMGEETEAIRLYERAFDLAAGRRGAFEALDRLYRREERWSEVVRIYEKQAAATSDPSLVRYLRVEIGRLWRERVPNADKSTASLKDALAVNAPDLGPILLLTNVLEASERWEQLVVVLEQLGEQLRDETDKIGVWHRLARVLETKLGQEDKALLVHERVLDKAPGDETSLRAVGRLHHRAGRWLEVISCWSRQLLHCQSDEEKAALYYRIGHIYERKLGRRDDAVSSYEIALGHSPGYGPAFRALDRILRRDRLWPRLLEVLGKQAETVRTPRQRAQIQHSMGQILELHQRDLPAAERAYATAIKLAPTFEAAVAALVQVCQARKDWKALDLHYCEILKRTDDPNARVAMLIRLGLLCELRLADPGRAALFYSDAIEAAPIGHGLLLSHLRAVRQDGGPQATVAPLQRLGVRTKDPRQQHGYRTLAALRDEVSAPSPTGTLFLEAAALGQHDPAVIDGVIRALSRSIHQPEAGQRLPDALVERAQACGSAPARALLLLEAGLAFERMGSMRDSALAYEDAGRAAPDFLPVLRGMRRLAAGSEQWSAVVALLSREAEVASHPDNKAGALLSAGEVASGRLNDARSALGMYRRLLDQQPEHERAYLRATALLERLADHAGLLDLLAARAAATRDPEARAVLLRRQAELQRDHLHDDRAAIAALRQAITLASQDLESYLMLAPLEEKQEWWQDAADRYRQIAELAAGTEASRSARLREAEIRERELGDREAARSILEELVVDPEDREAARYMAALCERMGQWARSRELYTQLAQTAKTPIERVEHLVSLASVLDGGFGDAQAAARAHDEAFALALGDPEVVRTLERRFGQLGDWRAFAQGGERAFQKARVQAPPQVTLRLAVARAYGTELKRADLAIRHLQAAVDMAPTDPVPATRLAQLQLDAARTDLAMPELRRALEIDPFYTPALRALGGLLLREGIPEAAQLLDETASYLEEGRMPLRPIGPRTVRRPLTPEEAQLYLPRAQGQGVRAVAELVALLEPYAPAILVETTGRIPRGDELPEANGVSLRVRSLTSALGLEAMRVFVDSDGSEAKLVADARLAIALGKQLTQPSALARLAFEVGRQVSFIAAHATLGAVAGPSELVAIIQAIALEEGPEPIRDLRRRLLKPIPRRLRKDAERIVLTSLTDMPRDVAAWCGEEQRWADRLGFLLARDPVVVLQALAPDPAQLRRSQRAVDLLRWLGTDTCWRTYTRLSQN